MKQASELLREVRKELKPREKLSACEWADKHFWLSPEYSAKAGKYNSDFTPYQKEPLAKISDPNTHRVILMWSSQSGKTLIQQIAIGFFISEKPSPMLFIQPSLGVASEYSKERIAPQIRDNPTLREKFSTGRDSGNTVTSKSFIGGNLSFVGSVSTSGLASRPVKVLLCDEIDRWEQTTEEGDPIALAEKRTATFYDWKNLMVSTPTEESSSRIYRAFLKGDQRYFHIPCPHCGHKQPLEWERIEYPYKSSDRAEPDKAQYRCVSCEELFTDINKRQLLLAGEWQATTVSDYGVSYHLSELYSPWRSWSDLARDYEAARVSGSQQMQVFQNTSLALPWKRNEEEKVEADKLLARSRESNYSSGFCPTGVLILTAGVDVQADRLECSVIGWGRNQHSWLILHTQLIGDTNLDSVWQDLEDLLDASFPHESGIELKVKLTCIDTGYRTQTAYQQIRARKAKNWKAVKGKDGSDRAIVSTPSTQEVNWQGKKIKNGIQLFTVGTYRAKESLLLDRVNIEFPEASKYVHLPADIDSEYAESLASEVLTKKHTNGVPKFVWVKTKQRNEALDCFVYALAAAHLAGVQRMNWTALEKRLFPKEEKPKTQSPKESNESPPNTDWMGGGSFWS